MSYRAAAAVGAAAAFLAFVPSLFAHEGHDRDDQPAWPGGNLASRAESTSNSVELVAIAKDGTLEIYLDDFVTNAALDNAAVEVETPDGPRPATGQFGQAYRLEAAFLATPGKYDLIATVSAGTVTEVLPFTIEIRAPSMPARAAAPSLRSRLMEFIRPATLTAAILGTLLGLGLAAIARRRRVPAVALLSVLFVGSVLSVSLAHEGHEHGEPRAAATGRTGDVAP